MPSTDGSYQIALLRHGRTLADDENRFEGPYDAPLTAVGVEQARRLAERWQADETRRYDRIISSPLIRAAKTARIIGEAIGATVTEDSRWKEWDVGRIAGLPKDEAARLYPLPAFVGPYDHLGGGVAESSLELHARAARAVQALLDLPAGRYLVVAHGCILNAALRSILGIPVPVNESGAFFRFDDTGHMDLRYERRAHRWIVMALVD